MMSLCLMVVGVSRGPNSRAPGYPVRANIANCP